MLFFSQVQSMKKRSDERDKTVEVDVVAVEPLQSTGTIDAATAHRDVA